MIDYLKGKVLRKYENAVTLFCGGVGLKVYVPSRLISEISVGEEVELFVEPVFPPEGAPSLYGFPNDEERETFRELLKIPKVGSKVALSIVSSFSPEQLKQIVASGDVDTLSSVHGLGKKLSKRIISELSARLKEKVEIPEEVMGALLSLGYTKGEINRCLAGVDFKDLSVEEGIKKALRILGKGK